MAVSRIYLDYAATTPLDKRVYAAMQPYYTNHFGNAASTHVEGQRTLRAIDMARQQVAALLHSQPQEIIFTSGATESANLALRGLVVAGDHIICSAFEHPAVWEACQHLAATGCTWIVAPILSTGIVDIEAIFNAIQPATKLISIMYVNNEIGTIQPIGEITERLAIVNQQRQAAGLAKIYFHTDAVQAAGFCPLDITRLGVDLMTLSAHKFYGPQGVGILYRRSDVPLQPIMYGGQHEYGLRPGTLPLALIVGCGAAATLLVDCESDRQQLARLRDQLLAGILELCPSARVNGSLAHRVANNLHVTFPGWQSELLVIRLDQVGIAVSAGAACASGAVVPSRTLQALHISQDVLGSSIRFTLGRPTCQADITKTLDVLKEILSTRS